MTANALIRGTPITGRTVLMLLAGFFGTIFAVNGVFLALALSTNTGIVANEPYRKGLKYNERIAADEHQTELGWKSDIAFDNTSGRLVVVLNDRDGIAVRGLNATVNIGRAATDREDISTPLTEVAPGRYESELPHHGFGSFVANLEARVPRDNAQGLVYRARRRLWIKP
jgi:nitrogen fixation protein FixH